MNADDVEMRQRYFVDQRVGCVAVRDRESTDPDAKGLSDTPMTSGVVFYRKGRRKHWKCQTCGHHVDDGYEVDPSDVKEAHDFCKALNDKAALASSLEPGNVETGRKE